MFENTVNSVGKHIHCFEKSSTKNTVDDLEFVNFYKTSNNRITQP